MTEFGADYSMEDWHSITDVARLASQGADGDLGMIVGEEKFLFPSDTDTDSATVATDEGMSIFADTDGDGQVDYVSNVSFDGHWSAWRWLGEVEKPGGVGESTPSYSGEKWDSRSWKCVDRGEWG